MTVFALGFVRCSGRFRGSLEPGSYRFGLELRAWKQRHLVFAFRQYFCGVVTDSPAPCGYNSMRP